MPSLLLAQVKATLGAADTFTSNGTNTQNGAGVNGVALNGNFNISISGTWAGTITLQRSNDSGANWRDVKTYTGNTEERGFEPTQGYIYKAGFKSGAWTSGSAVVEINR